MTEENDKGAGDGNHPLEASNQEEVKVDNIFPQHLAMMFPFEDLPVILIINHLYHPLSALSHIIITISEI